MSVISVEALRHVFPEQLLEHFDLVGSEVKSDKEAIDGILEVTFEEKAIAPEGGTQVWESKGFYSARIQDFPLRGRPVFLILKRRRWRHKETGESVSRELGFIAEGSRFTKEVAAFFKEIGRYPS
jgi:transposase